MNDLEISKRNDMLLSAQSSLAHIENAPTASASEATKAVRLLLDSYPQAKPSNPDVYMRQLRSLLVGAPLDAVMALINPHGGIVSQCVFLPTISEVHNWLGVHLAPRHALARSLRGTIHTLTNAEKEISPEEQAHVRARMALLTEQLKSKETQRLADIESRMKQRFAKTQHAHTLDELFASLDNLESMR